MIKAWHFIKDDGTAHGGYHASINIIDALQYSQGSIVRRVECGGKIIKGRDKLVCTESRELWRIDATNVLHEFSCRCAEDALALIDNPDQRAIDAIAAKRAWMRGEISSNELEAASESAINAATTAATVTAWEVAMASSKAALECPKLAALGAAWEAARAAAATVVVGVIRSWVKFRAQQKQNSILNAMVIAEAKKQGDEMKEVMRAKAITSLKSVYENGEEKNERETNTI